MNTLHTPTPWIVQIDEDRNDSSFTTIKVVDGSSESLSHPQGALTLANIQTFAPHLKEGIANAHLIAAAPDLLDALKALMVTEDMLRDPKCQVMQLARIAISKAEGKA
jgi:hypothetical protein